MVFTSYVFWGFYAVFCVFYAANLKFARSVKLQNVIVLVGSYFAYAWWDWRFLALIVAITIVTFVAARLIESGRYRKRALWAATAYALGALFVFKYFDFFVGEADQLLRAVGLETSIHGLSFILPVGISFYTFQSLTYVVDVYRRSSPASRSLLDYAAYIAFFPQLVAGPIERAAHLLTQFHGLRAPSGPDIVRGLELILTGLVMKIVVADNLAPTVDHIFSTPIEDQSGGVLALGLLYFTFQIYGDFCGYSTIAVGTARVLGFDLMQNFNTPYFARSPREFWQRWHISLSTFFRDYVYLPIGGSRVGTGRATANLLATFALSGLWHGANWTFVLWGFYHGALVAGQRLARRLPVLSWAFPGRTLLDIAFTFLLVLIGWSLFRSPDVGHSLAYLERVVADLCFPEDFKFVSIYIALCLGMDLAWRDNTSLRLDVGPFGARHRRSYISLAYYSALFWLLVFSIQKNEGATFIYFQF